MLKTLHVGIDISHHRQDVQLLDQQGASLGKRFPIINNHPGVEQLLSQVAQVAEEGQYAPVLLGLEATRIYWWHLYHALTHAQELAPYQPRVVLFNPRLIRGFREVYTVMDKTDPKDAFLIAERLRFGRLLEYPPADPGYFALQRLTRYRFHLVRAKAHALTFLFLAASEQTRLEPFGATSIALLTEFRGMDELAAIPCKSW